ncbi:hypothetical protein KC343_g1289 [Hortaea werneckii]|nr:hypothetical protein KC352_g8601 [Hortaea werneckii]KAI7571636.1 hypothetical protein KC317_g1461 [Hortaea werneckii]KAI7616067.1 hypothetical protein KC346_g6193 [Hortaea werneckii]KAI7636456.1 hypothetical protein KC343_g1289 [Hortaea werneckii]KAI7669616.1 hypothetical protein KC319_g6086 [Hortaea werneckii]
MDAAEASKKLDSDANPTQLTPETENDTKPNKPSHVSTNRSASQRRAASLSKIPVIASGSSSVSLATPQPSASTFKRPPGPRDRRVSLMSAEESRDDDQGGDYRRLSAADSVSNSTSSESTLEREDIVFLRRCENTLTTLITEQSRKAELAFKHAIVLHLPRAGRVVAVPDGNVRELQLWTEATGNALEVNPNILGHYAEGSMELRWLIVLLKTLFSADGKHIVVPFELLCHIGGSALKEKEQEQPEQAYDQDQETKNPAPGGEDEMQSKESETDYAHGFIELLNDEEDEEAVQFRFDFGQACGSELGSWSREKNQDGPYAFFGSVGPLSDGKLFATVFSDVDQYEAIIAKPEFLDGSDVRMLAHCRGDNTYVTADFRTLMDSFRNNIKLNFSFYSTSTDPTYTGPADLLKAAIASKSKDTYVNEVWDPRSPAQQARPPTYVDNVLYKHHEVWPIQDKDNADLLATSGETRFTMVCEKTFDKALIQIALVCDELMPFALLYQLQRTANILIYPVDEKTLTSLGVFDSSNRPTSKRLGYCSHFRTVFTCEVKRLLELFSEDAETLKGEIKMNTQHSFHGRSNTAVPRDPDPLVWTFRKDVYMPEELFGEAKRHWDDRSEVSAVAKTSSHYIGYNTASLASDSNFLYGLPNSTGGRRAEPLPRDESTTPGVDEPKDKVDPLESRDADGTTSFGSATQAPTDLLHTSFPISKDVTLPKTPSPQLLLTTSVDHEDPASKAASETVETPMSTAPDSSLIVNNTSALARKVSNPHSTEEGFIDTADGQNHRRQSSGLVEKETKSEPPTTGSPNSKSQSLDKGEQHITPASSRDLDHAIIHNLPATLNLLLTYGNLNEDSLHNGVRVAYNSLKEALARKNTLQAQLVAEDGRSSSSSSSAEGLIATPRQADGQLHNRAEEEQLFDVPPSTAKRTILHFVKKKGEADAETMDLEERLVEKRSREIKEAENAKQAWDRRTMGLDKEWQDEEDQAVEKLEMVVMVMMAVMLGAVYLAAAYW